MYCYKCGKQNDNTAAYCSSCGILLQTPQAQPQYQPRRLEDDPGMRLLLPVGQSPLAIIAGYMGLFSVMLIPAPFAIILGILAIRDIKTTGKYGMGRAIFGIAMGTLGCIAFLAIVAASLGNAAGGSRP